MSASLLALTLFSAIVCAAALTPVVIMAMWRYRILDAPDGVRKLHGRTVPLAGGLAVLGGSVIASATTFLIQHRLLLDSPEKRHFTLGLLLASGWVCLLGLIDDRGLLRGRQKFLGHIVAALILTASGCVISRLEFMNVRIELGILSVPFTIFWLVGAINAVNLMDGVDGLATSIGAILSGTFAIMSLITGHDLEAVIAVALCGSLIGFLPYNFPRARIFLGDTGSMLIGLLLGTLALRSSVKSQATLALAAPVAVLSVLIFDVMMAILRRKLTGRSLYSTDRGHLHHRLGQMGFPPVGVVLFVSLACAMCCAGALASLVHRSDWLAVCVAGTVIISCMIARVFGHNELKLLFNRTKSFLRSLFRVTSPCGTKGLHSALQIQGQLDWAPIWQELKGYAESFDLAQIELHISAPRLHEHYHAEWIRRSVEADRLWSTSIPLLNQGSIIGRIRLCGEISQTHDQSISNHVSDLIGGVKPMELQIEELLNLGSATVQSPVSSEAA